MVWRLTLRKLRWWKTVGGLVRNSRSFLRVNWWSQESLFKFLGSLIIQNWSCWKEIRSRIARAKNAFTKRKELLTKAFSLYLKKRISSKIPAWSSFELAIWFTWRLLSRNFQLVMNLVSFFDQCLNFKKNQNPFASLRIITSGTPPMN